jgi:hypothetical protein
MPPDATSPRAPNTRSQLFTRIALAAALLAVLSFGGAAFAEDPPASGAPPTPAKPPELGGGAESFLAPVETGKLIDWVTTLKGQLERLRTPPPSGPDDAQLRSAWETILENRLGNMIARLDKWQEPGRWVAVEDQPDQLVLAPGQWAGFVQSMAFLATELHGAWKQYQNVKLKKKSMTPAPPRDFSSPSYYRLSYPVGPLYQSILNRQTAARQLGVSRFGSHWQLLGRFRYAWDWSWDQSSTWWKYLERKEAHEQREKFEAALEVALEGTRDALSNTLLGLQVFVAAAQELEQERLRGICLACRTDDATLREMAETALRDMEKAQMEAERFQGKSYSDYGSLLRSWYRRQQAAISVLDITAKRLADDGTAEEAKDGKLEIGVVQGPTKDAPPSNTPTGR